MYFWLSPRLLWVSFDQILPEGGCAVGRGKPWQDRLDSVSFLPLWVQRTISGHSMSLMDGSEIQCLVAGSSVFGEIAADLLGLPINWDSRTDSGRGIKSMESRRRKTLSIDPSGRISQHGTLSLIFLSSSRSFYFKSP